MLPTFAPGTQGRAPYTMQFDTYEPVPKSMADEVMSKNAGSSSLLVIRGL